MREHDGAGGEGGAAEIVGGEQGGGVGGVSEGDVEEDALEDEEDADGEDADGEGGADPVDGGVGGPACEREGGFVRKLKKKKLTKKNRGGSVGWNAGMIMGFFESRDVCWTDNERVDMKDKPIPRLKDG